MEKELTEKKPKYERDRLSLDNQVVKSNSLVESRYRLSAFEQKVILLMCSKVSSTHEQFVEFPLTVNEFCEFIGVENKNYEMNRYVKKKCDDLLGKRFWRNTGTKEHPKWERLHLVFKYKLYTTRRQNNNEI